MCTTGLCTQQVFRGYLFGDYIMPSWEVVWQWLQAQALQSGCTVWLLLAGCLSGSQFLHLNNRNNNCTYIQGQRVVMRNEWNDPCQGFGTMVTSNCSKSTVPTTLVLRVFPHDKPNNQKRVKIKVESFNVWLIRLESYGLSLEGQKRNWKT